MHHPPPCDQPTLTGLLLLGFSLRTSDCYPSITVLAETLAAWNKCCFGGIISAFLTVHPLSYRARKGGSRLLWLLFVSNPLACQLGAWPAAKRVKQASPTNLDTLIVCCLCRSGRQLSPVQRRICVGLGQAATPVSSLHDAVVDACSRYIRLFTTRSHGRLRDDT